MIEWKGDVVYVSLATYERFRNLGEDMTRYRIASPLQPESHNAALKQHETATAAENHKETDD